MADFVTAIAKYQNLSEDAQKKAGQATGTTMDPQHVQFLADLIAMLDRKELDVSIPESLLKKQNYDPLPQTSKDAVQFALINLADQVRHIEEYYRSTKTPNASPQLQTMIELLWDRKSKLEEKYGDVLKL